MIKLNTKVGFTSYHRLLVRLCLLKKEILQEPIKVLNISHIKGKCWMI